MALAAVRRSVVDEKLDEYAAARSVGVLPEQEADGWAGEPSEWAEADSFTQKLSAFTQNNLSGFKQFVAERVAGEFDKDTVDAAIEAEVSRGGVLMYSFTSCPFCKKAKELLDDKGALYTVVELDELLVPPVEEFGRFGVRSFQCHHLLHRVARRPQLDERLHGRASALNADRLDPEEDQPGTDSAYARGRDCAGRVDADFGVLARCAAFH